jgi:hypothetical protein
MKTLWTDDYISDMATEAEIQISSAVNCIYVRFPLNIVLGNGIYDFTNIADAPTGPHRLTGIIRITWKSWTVHPVFQQQLRNIVAPLKPGSETTTSSRPLMYMRQGYGINKIKFFLSPNETITYDNSNVNTKASIQNNVIVAGWHIADPTGNTYRLPDHIREKLVMFYVMARAYRKEGKGQNLDAAKFYDAKYAALLDRFKKINEQLFASRTRTVSDIDPDRYGLKPPRPRLPPDFGEIVE